MRIHFVDAQHLDPQQMAIEEYEYRAASIWDCSDSRNTTKSVRVVQYIGGNSASQWPLPIIA